MNYYVSGIGTCTENDIIILITYNNLPVTGIYYDAFSGCDTLTNVEIINNIKNIEAHVFQNCTNLVKVTISDNIETIYKEAFDDCSYFYIINMIRLNI